MILLKQFYRRIDKVQKKMNESSHGFVKTIFSPPFMTGRYGYKMVLSAALFGEGNGIEKILNTICFYFKLVVVMFHFL